MPEDDLDIGFCPRCGDQLDGATPPAGLICWRCAADEEDLEVQPHTEGLHPDHSGRGPSSCPTVAAGMGCRGGCSWGSGRGWVVGGGR